MASHGGSKLDGEMTETADSHDGHTVPRGDAEAAQDGPYSGAGAHEGSSVGGIIAVGDGVDAFLVPDGAGAEGAVVEVVEAVLLLVAAELVPTWASVNPGSYMESTLPTLRALVAVCANLMSIPEAHAVANLDRLHRCADLTNDSNSLVAERLVGLEVVLIRSAET